MPAPQAIAELVERFTHNLDAYRSGAYKESQLRQEFVNPFFKALGWDVDNERGYAEAYKEVVHEDALKVGGATKAPDYSFRIGGARKFFVEAKKPSVDIAGEPSPAYQLRRYAWSAKLPLSILTDFEELAVYDTRVKPARTDKASTARVMFLAYTDYPARWDELAALFSPEAIRKGAFDKYAESTRRKKGTAEVDAAFLAEIEAWRTDLAHNLALRNPGLTQRQLNFAVQATIDRIVFLRICEDRGVEPYGRLQALLNGERVYPRLFELFERADERYNSGLFHFAPEPGRTAEPDTLSRTIVVDDAVLRDILRRLYYPESPYEFSVLPADILGQVYEQFLGKIIRLTPGHRAVVEEKPEVRKAGGVYYTPTYIVDYIVAHTLGPLLGNVAQPPSAVGENVAQPPPAVSGFGVPPSGGSSEDRVNAGLRTLTAEGCCATRAITPKQVEKLRILDPACGSGSFLLGAYQYLLDWHLAWYTAHDPEKWAKGHSPALYQVSGPPSPLPNLQSEICNLQSSWRLTLAERRRILLNSIFGVDIDAQAVEVTKLSLLLKVLEGASREVIESQLKLFHERALPDLASNVKCGNSLIGPDFYNGQQGTLFDDEERYRINDFDWHKGFPTAMKAGGFDAILGNPPYVRIQTLRQWAPEEAEYYRRRYTAARKGNYDLYVVFVERALSLLSPHGRLGFILPHKFFNSKYGEPLRTHIATGRHLAEIVHFGSQQVFRGATTYTCLLLLEMAARTRCDFTRVDDIESWREKGTAAKGTIALGALTGAEWNFVVGPEAELYERLLAQPVTLGQIADIFVGIQTSADDVFIMELVEARRRTVVLRSRALARRWEFETGIVRPVVSGTDIGRYAPLPRRQYTLFPYSVRREAPTLMSLRYLEGRYPRAAEYLVLNKKRLQEREDGKFKRGDWHRFGRNQNVGIQGRVKICVPRLVETLHATYDADGSRVLDNVDVGGVTLKEPYQAQGLLSILALLNSRLLRWYFPCVSAPFRGGWRSANRQFLSRLPIRLIDFSDRADKARHQRIVQLAGHMLTLHKKRPTDWTAHQHVVHDRYIAAMDRQIDRLVYELYGLSDAEIKIVEEATGK
ncbi:MAG: restriction endonuclease subunit M [Planctomycetes bacterium]|nr:restriction endonuclease subunit M [Planctomycetota bacterium]